MCWFNFLYFTFYVYASKKCILSGDTAYNGTFDSHYGNTLQMFCTSCKVWYTYTYNTRYIRTYTFGNTFHGTWLVHETRMMKICSTWFSFNVCFRKHFCLGNIYACHWKLAETNVYKVSNICIFSFESVTSIRILCLVSVICSQCELHIDQYQLYDCVFESGDDVWIIQFDYLAVLLSGSFNLISWPPVIINSNKFSPLTINNPSLTDQNQHIKQAEWLFSIFSHFRCHSSFLHFIGVSPQSPHQPILTSTVRTDQNIHGSAFCALYIYIIINWQSFPKTPDQQ